MSAKNVVQRCAGLGVLAFALVVVGAVQSRADQWDRARAEVQGKIDTWKTLSGQIFPGKTFEDGKDVIALDTPYRAVDAAVVPISIKAKQPQTKDHYIKTLYLIIDENPSPVAAVFHMTPGMGSADISTRVRINKYTNVRAIAEENDGKYYMVKNFVKASGGCSAPALDDKAAAMARLGKMKFKVLKAASVGQPVEAKLMISHPNYSGLQFDQITRMDIPADFVKTIDISVDGRKLMTADTDISISENPTFVFHYLDPKGGKITANIVDSAGRKFEKSWPASRTSNGES